MIDKGFTIAVSGKGGVGKTMLAALLIRNLSEKGCVLAIDADPDSNLPQALGIPAKRSVGEVRESIVNAPARSAIADNKPAAFEKALYELVEETDKIDLVVMGRSEGPGCYCVISNILRQVIDSKAANYNFTVIDCEAGLEHLSRRTTRDVDLMVVVLEPTLNGIVTAKRVYELAGELDIGFGQIMVVANKVTAENEITLKELAKKHNLKIDAYLPYDVQINRFDAMGKSIIELPIESPASLAMKELSDKIVECLNDNSHSSFYNQT